MNDRITRLLDEDARNGNDHDRQRAEEWRAVVQSRLESERRRQERRQERQAAVDAVSGGQLTP